MLTTTNYKKISILAIHYMLTTTINKFFFFFFIMKKIFSNFKKIFKKKPRENFLEIYFKLDNFKI